MTGVDNSVSALEGVSASIFEELSAATPSWAGRRLPGDQGEEEEEHSTGWSSSSQVLPPSLILNVVNCEDLSYIILPHTHTFSLVDSGDEPVGDADSGMSTSHSPEENFKQFSSLQDQEDTLSLSPVSPGLDTAATRLELLDPTHRGLHRLENISHI